MPYQLLEEPPLSHEQPVIPDNIVSFVSRRSIRSRYLGRARSELALLAAGGWALLQDQFNQNSALIARS
ncbi:unnamed protein product [Zymoseptoria tritici ST99CH_3D7]|uniref:Uncharacterized protein n=1 Tax=Zymoseptoria tritici (strain ST99CH_3D7) TaxID=1276538 RepID=A0A1X7RS13_ZYMT9|nr:unnamed protein product [Zymoseptoria tritici ST99CH_3D7]